MEIKAVLGIIAAALALVAYWRYIKDIFKGTTRPHIFSWLLWAVLTAIISALQLSSGSAWGALTTFSICAISLIIFFAGLRNGKKMIKKIDVVFLVVGLLTIPIWLVVHQPVISMLILMAIDSLAFAPTIRKSWHEPYTETLSTYVITVFRHILALIAVSEYNIITTLFPATWIVLNTFFTVMLIARRQKIPPPPTTN